MAPATPLDLLRAQTAFWWLAVETQQVMTMRLLGMAGLWSVTGTENARMVDEKAPAFAEAMAKGAASAMSGGRPDQIALAAMKPLRKRTRANSRRLTKRGVKWP